MTIITRSTEPPPPVGTCIGVPAMKRFAVDLYFRRAPVWGGEYRAYDKAGAIEQAKQWARECGWTERVTKVSVREVRS